MERQVHIESLSAKNRTCLVIEVERKAANSVKSVSDRPIQLKGPNTMQNGPGICCRSKQSEMPLEPNMHYR